MNATVSFVVAAGASVLFLSGCALTSKAEAREFRYFSVDPAAVQGKADAPAPATAGSELRIGRVSASGHLRNRLAYRTSAVEIGVYDDLRWTERPEEYLRRAVAHALFDERGLTQIVAGLAPTLDVELLAFEEVRKGEKRMARVSMHFALHDERTVLAADTVTIEIPARGDQSTEDVVASISDALDAATAKVADDVTQALASSAAVAAKPEPLTPPP